MRVFLGIVFDRFGGSSIRITLSKYRVNRTALDAVVPGFYLRLCIGLGLCSMLYLLPANFGESAIAAV